MSVVDYDIGEPKNMTIVKLFEAQVAKSPDATAVRFEQKDLTYIQLNHRSNQLAHSLQKLGAGKEQMVGLFLERSLEMVTGILGVLKAGGAYVPFDPDYPIERTSYMLKDTQVPILLTQSHLKNKISAILETGPVSPKLKILYLDSDGDDIAQESTDNPLDGAAADNLAYTIYTSGSTGSPKGVMNEHQGIYNRMMWMLDALPLSKDDRVLQKTPYSFDVSIWEFFFPLLSGATLVLAKPGGHKDSDYLVDLISEEGITAVHFVPSMLQVFLLNDRVEQCHTLKRVICSGEALPFELQERFFSRLDAELFNLYGPTEAAIEVTFWTCQKESDLSVVPIGRPLPNTQTHLLDAELKPVKNGESGELHIGGVQVARGYLNLPDLTAERFIPDPFSQDPKARLYKTGDLACSLPDGNILYLGRMDHQVKIRGNRVELGEIESTLTKYPGIREAVVTTYEYTSADKRLAAYIVIDTEAAFSIRRVRDFLAAKLPEYMIPSSFILMDQMPLTPSGKVNRKELPAPSRERPTLTDIYIAPQNLIEEKLASIWEEVIGRERVGIHDNFLELGGDSILSIQIATRANLAGIHLSPGHIFQHQTIAELAVIAGSSAATHQEPRSITGPAQLTPIQQWFFEQDFPEPQKWHQSFVLEARKALDSSRLEQAIQQLIIDHDALRLRFKLVGGSWQPFVIPTSEVVPFSHIKHPGITSDQQKIVLQKTLAEMQDTLDLSEGPLFRAALIDFGSDHPEYLLLVIHQLVIDGVSWRLLLERIELLYHQHDQNQPVQPTFRTTDYTYWSQRINEYALSKTNQLEIPYWLSMYKTPAAQLPMDGFAENELDGDVSSNTVSVSIRIDDTRTLLTEVPKAYRTFITDIMLTAFLDSISQWTGEPEQLIDIVGHGREQILSDVDQSNTIGCFETIYPVLLNIGTQSDPGQKIIAVKEQLRRIPNGGIGFGLLRYLNGTNETGKKFHVLPQANVCFHYLGQVDHMLPHASILKISKDYPYPKRNLEGNRRYMLEVTSGVIQDQLQLIYTYNKNKFQQSTIDKLASGFVHSLEELIRHCKSTTAAHYTPSDFPEANLSQQELDDLLSEIEDFGG